MSGQPDRSLVVGESLVDIVVDPSDAERRFPGGSPLNVAIGLARLGWPTTLLTRVGRDPGGELIQAHLAASGVTLWPGSTVDSRTSTARATVDQTGQARYEFDLDWSIPEVKPTAVSHLHTGSIGAIVQPGADVVQGMFRRHEPRILRSFDPNIRPALMGKRDSVVHQVEELARTCHIVKMSDEDADWLYPGMSDRALARRFEGLGVTLFAVTRGADGCFLACSGTELTLPAAPVQLVDTIGAGDAFMSGLLFAILSQGLFDKIRAGTLPDHELQDAGRYALASAAVTVSREGASPPTNADLMRQLTTGTGSTPTWECVASVR